MTRGFSWAQKCSVEMDGKLSEGHQNNIPFIISCRHSVNWNVLYVRWIHIGCGLHEKKVHLRNIFLL